MERFDVVAADATVAQLSGYGILLTLPNAWRKKTRRVKKHLPIGYVETRSTNIDQSFSLSSPPLAFTLKTQL